MKQHITKDELYEASNEAIDKLAEWGRKKGYIGKDEQHFFLTIGQMIEFLGHRLVDIDFGNDFDGPIVDMITDKIDKKGEFQAKELCDGLWEAVKEVLKSID